MGFGLLHFYFCIIIKCPTNGLIILLIKGVDGTLNLSSPYGWTRLSYEPQFNELHTMKRQKANNVASHLARVKPGISDGAGVVVW